MTTLTPPALPLLLPLWTDGAPPNVLEQTLAIDRRISKRLRCARCRTRGLDFRPQHSGRRYRVLCVCPSCGQVNEL